MIFDAAGRSFQALRLLFLGEHFSYGADHDAENAGAKDKPWGGFTNEGACNAGDKEYRKA